MNMLSPILRRLRVEPPFQSWMWPLLAHSCLAREHQLLCEGGPEPVVPSHTAQVSVTYLSGAFPMGLHKCRATCRWVSCIPTPRTPCLHHLWFSLL